MPETISRAEMRACARVSVIVTSCRTGTPQAKRESVSTALTTIAQVRGSASRFVIMKYFGKVWNRIQTSGAVNSWQDRVRAKLRQIHVRGSLLRRRDFGYQPSIFG